MQHCAARTVRINSVHNTAEKITHSLRWQGIDRYLLSAQPSRKIWKIFPVAFSEDLHIILSSGRSALRTNGKWQYAEQSRCPKKRFWFRGSVFIALEIKRRTVCVTMRCAFCVHSKVIWRKHLIYSVLRMIRFFLFVIHCSILPRYLRCGLR